MTRTARRAAVATFLVGVLAARVLLPPQHVRAQGTCTTGASCDDGNPCTDDICDPNLGCLHASNSSSCNDGSACTTNDVCADGACIGGAPAPGCTPCDAAATIPAAGGTFIGVTSGASTLVGTCASTAVSPERVYRWTPAASGVARIETCGSVTTFDTVVYLGHGSCSGAEVACNDDTATCATGEPSTYHGSHMAPTVTAGETYYIVVDGWGGASGTYALTVIPPNTCGNGVREGVEECDGTDASGCAPGQCTANCTCSTTPGLPDLVPEIADVSIERNATVATGDVAEGCAESTSGGDLLRFTARTKNVSDADLHLGDPLCPSPCSDHPLEVCGNPDFLCSPAAGHNHAHYTNYARYELLDASDQAVVVGHKQGFCLRDSVCAAPKYSCVDQGITAGCYDEYNAVLGCQYIDITATPPGAYTLRVTLDPFGKIAEVDESNNVATVPVTIPPPGTTTTTLPSGSCPASALIPPEGGILQGVTSGASVLSGCVSETGGAPEQVFQWTPDTSGQATIETCGAATTYDTVLYVRSGSCNGTEVACNDDTSNCATADGCATYHGSRVTLTVAAGVSYFVVVDGYTGSCGGDRGTFQLKVIPPTTTTTSTSTTTVPTTTTTTTSTTTTTTSSTTTTTTTSTTSTTAPPAACVAATIIPAAGGTFTGTTAGASGLVGACGSTWASPEKVFQWTPAKSGTAKMDTCGSRTKFSTVVYLRRRDCQTGSEIACNQGACIASGSARGSRISATVTAGEKYYIVVDGNAGQAGAFKLRVTPP